MRWFARSRNLVEYYHRWGGADLSDAALGIKRLADQTPFTVTKAFSCDVVIALT